MATQLNIDYLQLLTDESSFLETKLENYFVNGSTQTFIKHSSLKKTAQMKTPIQLEPLTFGPTIKKTVF